MKVLAYALPRCRCAPEIIRATCTEPVRRIVVVQVLVYSLQEKGIESEVTVVPQKLRSCQTYIPTERAAGRRLFRVALSVDASDVRLLEEIALYPRDKEVLCIYEIRFFCSHRYNAN